MDSSLISKAINVNRFMDSAGVPDQLEKTIGAAIRETAAGNLQATKDLFESLNPLNIAAGNLTAPAPQGFVGRPMENYIRRFAELRNTYSASIQSQPSLELGNSFVNSLLGRGLGQLDPAMVAQALEGAIGNLQSAVQDKLTAMDSAMPMKRKKKKKGLGGKLKKGLKKIKSKMSKTVKGVARAGKGVFAKVGKGLFKGVIGGVKGLFSGKLLKGIGGILKPGGGLLGGLIGGPIGSRMIGQIAGKKAAGLGQIFGHINNMLSVVKKVQKGAGDVLMNGMFSRIRV